MNFQVGIFSCFSLGKLKMIKKRPIYSFPDIFRLDKTSLTEYFGLDEYFFPGS
jgi:hypothetical protein